MKKPFHTKAVLTVLGLLVASWLAPSAFADNTFTIAVIPDTQFYVDSGNTLTTSPAYTQPSANESALYFQGETQWLVNNQAALNLAFVTHVGDVVENGDGTSNGTTPLTPIWPASAEYTRAYAAMQVLANAGIPFGMTPGNHDYDNYYYSANSRPLMQNSNMWVQYFGSQSPLFKGQTWYGGASDTAQTNPQCTNIGMSSYQTFTAGGKKFLHISLELEAGPAIIAWAQGVINNHQGYATIVTTHSYISPFAAGSTELPAWTQTSSPTQANPNNASYNAASYSTNSPCGGNGGAGIFQNLIYPNDQIFLVISGHSYNSTNLSGAYPGSSQGEGMRMDYNVAGHPVYQVLTDFQDNIVNHDNSVPNLLAPPYPYACDSTGNCPLNTAGHVAQAFQNGVSDPGGDGWIRLITFDMTTNTMHFWTYSPLLNSGNGWYAGQCSGVPCDCTSNTCDSTFEQPWQFSDFYWQATPGQLALPIQVTNATPVTPNPVLGKKK